LAAAAVRQRAVPKIQQAGVQAKRSISAGRLFLQKVVIAAHSKGGKILTFCRRLSLRARHLATEGWRLTRQAEGGKNIRFASWLHVKE
jgi:hypothetical protein